VAVHCLPVQQALTDNFTLLPSLTFNGSPEGVTNSTATKEATEFSFLAIRIETDSHRHLGGQILIIGSNGLCQDDVPL
jgi:hypothetical protein